ncbi:MAG TPA: PfkB family carbohydrate kinase [Jatrophihabitantaceae bacterium]|nr:PfkB family carbohydrate kinase [Jatrophihabitantaceae bacterium]
MTRVVCLGDLMVDVLTTLAEPLQLGSDTAAEVRWTGGGSAANTACWLATADVRSVFVGRVGDDVPGTAAVEQLRAAGVDPVVSVDVERPTGTCVVLVDAQHERTMIPSPGANAAITRADLDAVGLAPGDHLHVSGYALFGGAHDTARAAIERAHELGLSVSIGAASSAPLRKAGAAAFFDWARDSTVFANRDEAQVLSGTPDPTAAAQAIAARTGHAVVTAGADGAAWSDGEQVVSVAPDPVRVLDSTGAGDAFSAGFLIARLGRAAPEVALARAHALAAEACRVIGGRPLSART